MTMFRTQFNILIEENICSSNFKCEVLDITSLMMKHLQTINRAQRASRTPQFNIGT